MRKQPENALSFARKALPLSPLLGGRKPLDVTFEELPGSEAELGNEYQWHYAERNLPEPIDEDEEADHHA